MGNVTSLVLCPINKNLLYNTPCLFLLQLPPTLSQIVVPTEIEGKNGIFED